MRERGEKCKTWVSVDLKILNYWITSQHPNTGPKPQCTLQSNSGPETRNKIRKHAVKRNCCWDEFVSSVTEVACISLHLSTTILETLSRNENIWQARCGGGGSGDSCQAGQRCPVTQKSTALLFNFPVYKCLEIVNVARKLNSVMQSVMTNYYMFSKVQTGRIIQRGSYTHSLV